jgi:hypothetical protein
VTWFAELFPRDLADGFSAPFAKLPADRGKSMPRATTGNSVSIFAFVLVVCHCNDLPHVAGLVSGRHTFLLRPGTSLVVNYGFVWKKMSEHAV